MIQLTSVTPKFRINLLKILQGFGTSIVLQISGRLRELSVAGVYILPLSCSRERGIIRDFMKFEVSLFKNSHFLSYFEVNFSEIWLILR